MNSSEIIFSKIAPGYVIIDVFRLSHNFFKADDLSRVTSLLPFFMASDDGKIRKLFFGLMLLISSKKYEAFSWFSKIKKLLCLDLYEMKSAMKDNCDPLIFFRLILIFFSQLTRFNNFLLFLSSIKSCDKSIFFKLAKG